MSVIAVLAVLAILVLAIAFGLPRLLQALGLHPHVEIPPLPVEGRRALVITTSHDRLDPLDKKTGVYASELTVPYLAFRDAGMQVDIASIQGGPVPLEPISLRWPLATPQDRRFMADEAARKALDRSLKVDDIDFTDYALVFLAGGWGAAYDLGQSAVLGEQISRAWAAGAVVGGICHGPLGLLQARDTDGRPLVSGRQLTSVTDKQIRELGITATPLHPETALREAGARFEGRTAWRDIFASHVAEDGRLVTGQNQNDGAEVSHRMMDALVRASA